MLHLAEGLKQSGLIFRTHTNACIVHGELNPGLEANVLAVQHNAHLTSLGKLDGVAGEIEQDLAQSAPVRVKHQLSVRNCHIELQTFLFREGKEGIAYLLHYVLEYDRLDVQ